MYKNYSHSESTKPFYDNNFCFYSPRTMRSNRQLYCSIWGYVEIFLWAESCWVYCWIYSGALRCLNVCMRVLKVDANYWLFINLDVIYFGIQTCGTCTVKFYSTFFLYHLFLSGRRWYSSTSKRFLTQGVWTYPSSRRTLYFWRGQCYPGYDSELKWQRCSFHPHSTVSNLHPSLLYVIE